jgi:hypothetical protein
MHLVYPTFLYNGIVFRHILVVRHEHERCVFKIDTILFAPLKNVSYTHPIRKSEILGDVMFEYNE